MSGIDMTSGILSSNGGFTTVSNFDITDSSFQVRRLESVA